MGSNNSQPTPPAPRPANHQQAPALQTRSHLHSHSNPPNNSGRVQNPSSPDIYGSDPFASESDLEFLDLEVSPDPVQPPPPRTSRANQPANSRNRTPAQVVDLIGSSDDDDDVIVAMPPSTRASASKKRRQDAPPKDERPAKAARILSSSTTRRSTPAVKKESKQGSSPKVVDLVNIDGNEKYEEFKAKQQAKLIKQQQQEEADRPIKLSEFQCIICMDNPTDLTVTHCGMFTRDSQIARLLEVLMNVC